MNKGDEGLKRRGRHVEVHAWVPPTYFTSSFMNPCMKMVML